MPRSPPHRLGSSMFRITARLRTRQSRRTRGQGLVEFALVLPIILLLTMTALDFGRIYLGYINVQNMARVAANFAANNAADLYDTTSTKHAETLLKYQNQIALDAAATNCRLPGGTAPQPTYTDVDGNGEPDGIGDNATVGLTCSFQVITPFISTIIGNSVNVSTSVVFPIKSGMSGTSNTSSGGWCGSPPNASINVSPGTTGSMPSFTVTFTDASGGCPATAWSWNFGDGSATSTAQDPPAHAYTAVGTYTVTMRASNSVGYTDALPVTITVLALVTPPPLCWVPSFTDVQRSAAQGIWAAAGFTTTVQPDNGNWKIKSQSIVGGSQVPCSSPITVSNH